MEIDRYEKLKEIIKSETAKNEVVELVENVIGIFLKDPVAAIKTIKQFKELPSTLRMGLYWEHFFEYLINVYDYDNQSGMIYDNNMKKFSELLADQTPNSESGYEGNIIQLRENAKRIIKLIDDASTIQKSVYYANLTRAALNDRISRAKFFKLCNCIKFLTEEDLLFFIDDIQIMKAGTITEDRESIDDFRAVGLLLEVDGGFSYTQRAFDLYNFGLKYDEKSLACENIQSRLVLTETKSEDIEKLFSVSDSTLNIGRNGQ